MPFEFLRPFLLALLLLSGTIAPAGAEIRSLFSEPVPLILKDGRLAIVSAFAVPFEVTSAELADEDRTELADLIRMHATGCFLTAQVIGHVDPGAGKDGGTLASHRLARARADLIQSMMVEAGLPGDAVASVWDWQFSIPESRATLWFFELPPDGECNARTTADARAQSAGTGGPTATRKAVERQHAAAAMEEGGKAAGENAPTARETPPAEAPSAAASGEKTVARKEPASPAGETADTVPATEPEKGTGTPEATSAAPQAPPRKLTAAEPEIAPPAPLEPAAGSAGAPEPTSPETPSSQTQEAEPSRIAAAEAPAMSEAEAQLEIVFDVNSSFLPQGSARRLKAFLDSLKGGKYAVEVVTAVDSGPVRNASPEEARRYNRWIAERRGKRVAEWLRRRGDGIIASIREGFRDNDPSRKVIVRARPIR